jgi:hypothetical protein
MKRMRYALVSLLASNVLLLSFLLLNAIRIRSSLLTSHIGRPGQEIPQANPNGFHIWLFFIFRMAHRGITDSSPCARRFRSSSAPFDTTRYRRRHRPFCIIGDIRDSQSRLAPRPRNIHKHKLSVDLINADVDGGVFALLRLAK